ncbi:SMC5-SMC6 complex localization factor protein 1-like [Diadema antillarum]|uniref:SMC5-SMC6 complex localization factor protein 1-like n=1 Tax=Diadema antillarum TaxID=105358 RepID=UPI003A8479CE
MSKTSRRAGSRRRREFLLTGFTEEQRRDCCAKVVALGGYYHEGTAYVKSCTHIICDKPMRSEKFLSGCASGKWILKPTYIRSSADQGYWQDELDHEWCAEDRADTDVSADILAAPRRWRKVLSSSGVGAFHGWKVLLHFGTSRRKSDVYKRILLAGGAQSVLPRLPATHVASLASRLTHVFADRSLKDDVKVLKEEGVPCLAPEFIGEHLFQVEPCMTKFGLWEAAEMPSQIGSCQDILLSSMRKQTSADTPSTGPVPSGGVPDSVGPEEVTPGLIPGPGNGMTGNDPGRGVKRKLHFDPCQLKEALQILKKRKESSQHFPLVPYTMMIPRSKKTFQCATTDPRDFPRPYHSSLHNFVEGVLEDSQWQDSLSCIASTISTEFYPPPEILHHIMMKVLQSNDMAFCGTAVHTLKQVLCLHSPASHPSLRSLYLGAMAPSSGNRPIGHKHPWEFLKCVIRRALDGRQVTEDAPDHENEQSVKVAMDTAEQLLHFLVTVMEEDFMAAVKRVNDGSEGLASSGPAWCILAHILWSSQLERASSRSSTNLTQLLGLFVDAVRMATVCQDWMSVAGLVATLVQIAAEVSARLGELRSPNNPSKGRDENQEKFIERLASLAKQNDIPKSKACLETFLSLLKPSWVCQGVAESFLQTYSDQLVAESSAFWAHQPLTLKKIVYYYFYHAPHPARTHREENTKDAAAAPLKTISNQQPPSSKTAPRKNISVNRKNCRGETPLHQACIKGDVERVRELLASPFIDVNAQDNVGWTPLHEACNHGNINCVQELLNFHPDRMLPTGNSCLKLNLEIAPSCGTTALHDAVCNGHVEVARLLVAVAGMRISTIKDKQGKTSMDYAITDTMKNALKGSGPTPSEKENETRSVYSTSDLLRLDSKSAMPHPSLYKHFLGSAAEDSDAKPIPQDEGEKFVVTLMTLLQSYVRSRDLHRVKGEVDLIRAQHKMAERKSHTTGAPESFSEKTPFVSLVASPTLAKAGLPPAYPPPDTLHTFSASFRTLLEDMEVFADLSRYTEDLKAHLRQLGLTTDTPKAGPCTSVSRSLRLISHLCSIMS